MRSLNIFVVHSSHVPTDHLPNGEGWIVYNYLRGLAERGHTVHVAVPRVEMRGPVPPGVHLHFVPQRQGGGALARLLYLRSVRALLTQLTKSIHFDIAQQFTPVETGLSLGLWGTGIPLVLGPYSGFWPPDADGAGQTLSTLSKVKRAVRDGLASIQQRQARALLLMCPAAIERIESQAREALVHVVSPGIDIEAYPERDRVPDKPSILFLANLYHRKGIYTLLKAFDRVAQAIPDCTLEIWGDGVEAAAVEVRARQSRFQHRIQRRGRAARDKVAEIMRSHSVYCMPSHGEPFGMTLLEAMASGVPIVTTDSGGPPYIVHQAGGRIVPMHDAERLADALIEVLSSIELQKSMGTYNRRRIEQEFDWRRSLDRMEYVYERVLSTRADRSGGRRRCRAG